MNIHEYQAKELLREYGVAVPRGKMAFSVEEAVANARDLGGDIFVVKAQILLKFIVFPPLHSLVYFRFQPVPDILFLMLETDV